MGCFYSFNSFMPTSQIPGSISRFMSWRTTTCSESPSCNCSWCRQGHDALALSLAPQSA